MMKRGLEGKECHDTTLISQEVKLLFVAPDSKEPDKNAALGSAFCLLIAQTLTAWLVRRGIARDSINWVIMWWRAAEIRSRSSKRSGPASNEMVSLYSTHL